MADRGGGGGGGVGGGDGQKYKKIEYLENKSSFLHKTFW